MSKHVVVIGGGAWGTALALAISRAGSTVSLLVRDANTAQSINTNRRHPTRLEDAEIDEGIYATIDLSCISDVTYLVAAVPAQSLRQALHGIIPYIQDKTSIISAAKGIEQGSLLRMSEVIQEVIPHITRAVIAGPSFAFDIAQARPTTVVVASDCLEKARELSQLFASENVYPFACTDVVGVEIGGALKNVYSIASGIVFGRKLGASAQAAIVTCGFEEMSRIATALGAQRDTLTGLSGLGDLILSANSEGSRNFTLGVRIAQCIPISSSLLTEGANTASAALDLARRHEVSTPILEAIVDLISGKTASDTVVSDLLKKVLYQS